MEIYPGFPAHQLIVEEGAVKGVITGDLGVAKDGHHKDGFTPGMELRAKYTLFAEGARGSLSKQLCEKFELQKGREPQKFGIGLKELWELPPGQHRPVWCCTAWAGRWTMRPAAGCSSITGAKIFARSALSSISITKIPGWTRSANSSAPRPIRRSPRCSSGGKRIGYGARAITEGGYQSVPKLSFPGGALIGCAAGFVNLPRIKGSHNAMKTGMLAAEAVAEALQAGRADDSLPGYEMAYRQSWVAKDLYLVRNAKPLWSRLGSVLALPFIGLDMWTNQLFGCFPVRNPEPWGTRLCRAEKGRRQHQNFLSPARRAINLRSAVQCVSFGHQS